MKRILSLLAGLFLLAGIGGSWMLSLKETPEKEKSRIEANLRAQINAMRSDADRIRHGESPYDFAGLESGRAYFLYQNGQLHAWSTNEFVPEGYSFADTSAVRYLRMGGSDFLIREWSLDNDRYLVGLLPLFRQYKITNAYLQPQWNKVIFGNAQLNLHDRSIKGGQSISYDGCELFRVDLVPEASAELTATLTAFAFLLAIVCVIILAGLYLRRVGHTQPELAFLLLAAVLATGRVVMVATAFPSSLFSIALFDPQYFASSEWNPSLGDLLLNAVVVFVLCLALFRNYFRFHSLHWLLKRKSTSFLLGVFGATACFFGLLYPFIVVQTLYNNSAISLSISDTLRWDGLRVVSFMVVVLSALSSFLFVHIFVRILTSISHSLLRFLLMLLLGLIVFALINESTGQRYLLVAILSIVYLLVVYRTRLVHATGTQGYAAFAYFILAVLCYSIELGYGVRYFTEKERSQAQVRFANNFLVDRDYLGEFLLNDARRQIEQDVFIQSRLSSPFLGKEAVREKIRQVFLAAYLDRYVVDIRLFNSSGESLNDDSNETFSSLINSYNGITSDTEYPGVYVVNRLGPGLTQKYVVVARVQHNTLIQGYVVMEFSLKRYIPESVYPELLVDNRFQQVYQPQNFSFAILSSNKILISYGDFDYEKLRPERFNAKDVESDSYEAFGYHHVLVDGGSGNTAIVSSRDDSMILQFADYSFQFVLGILVLLFLLLIQGIRALMRPQGLLISTRIQLLLNMAFFVPLVLVSVIAMTLVSGAFKDKMNEEYRNKSQDFAGQLSRLISDESPGAGQTGNQLTNWSKLADVDANLYTPDGKLEASSQPLIFENQLQAPYLSPEAMAAVAGGSHNFIATEHIGRLNYFVSYATLRSPETGQLLGVLGIPYFQSGRSLERMQITVLSNIISIFSVVFILLLASFYFISRWFTYPFKLITSSLERTSLTHMNKPLEWHSNDEIGMMVKQYNEMLNNLQASKAELERNQRERAWREIAQQVAHEIKNPLTPMKLKLQQLERLAQQAGDDQGMLHKTIQALLGQVEILNGIASSFSTFAKMPEPHMQKVELSALIKKITDLHKSSGVISFTADGPVTVMADEQLLSRIVSNLILNAEQAAAPGRSLRIDIRLSGYDGLSKLTVEDNGTGMSDEIRQKAFLPQFSTKQSGSGLGLAIARQGIEQMGGTITFDTHPGKGTTFHIELPILAQ